MLGSLRKNASSWLIKTILILIVIVFVLWGGYSYQERRKSHLVRIDDVYITWQQYAKAYEQLRDFYRRQLGKDFSEEMLSKFNVKQQALDLLIDRVLLLKKASELGISISPAELQETIKAIPAFQTNGQFDLRRYQLILQQNRMTPEIFEQELAQTLTLKKLEDLVVRQVTVSDKEVIDYVRMLKTDKQFLCIDVPWAKYESGISITDENLKAYYAAHEKLYEEPEKRKIAYVLFPLSDFAKNVSITDDELKNYYEEHRKDYHQDKAVHARHVLFRVDPDAPSEQVEAVRKKAQEILNLAKAGQDFATLAKNYSEDPGTAMNGGDLGYITESQVIKEFADAAFAMKAGEISDLVQTPFGFHIIKVEDVRPERDLPFDDVKNNIKEKLTEIKARDEAYSKAKEFADAAFAAKDIMQSAAKRGLVLVDVNEWLSVSQPLPAFPENTEVVKKLFELPDKGVSDVLEVKNGFIVAQVKAIQPPRIPGLDEIKDRVEKDYRREKAEEQALKEASSFLERARNAGSLEKVAAEINIKAEKSPFLNRLKPDIGFGVWGDELERLMDLTEAVPFTEKPIKGMTGYKVCQWIDVKMPDEKVVEDEAKRFKPMLVEQLTRSYWDGWRKSLRSLSRVEVLQEL
ncbi:MAG: SurA N-terminal domain-containing protein [Thermodesulforhabdaceae bacterium]